jgi:tripartite-type tricarboxylate transporter receptor subunit TctC
VLKALSPDFGAQRPALSSPRPPHGRALRALAYCVLPASLVAAVPAAAQSVADFYRGKQITLMVGSSPGGGYDAVARLVARHLGNLIPGHPAIVVQNTPGGGSITMSNRIYRVEAQDGTVLGLVQRGVLLAQFIKQPNVQFDVTKFRWIGNVSPETSLVVAWSSAPVKSAQDLLSKELIVGGTGATSDLEASARLLGEAMGAKGSADWSWSEIKTRHADFLRDGKITLILQNALAKAADLPDVPLAMDFIRDDTDRKAAALYFGLKQVARPILAGPQVPAERADALRKAFAALKDDADYQADARRLGLDDPTAGSDIDRFVGLAAAASPEVARRLTDVLNPGK